MQTENLEGQESIFGRDSGFGKMSSALSQVGGTLKRVRRSLGRIFKKSSKRSSKLKNHTFMLLDLRPGAGNMLGAYWEYDPPWLGSFGTLNTSECPKDAVECSLWQILQATAPSQYSLSQTACLGILRRAECRGKSLPPLLEAALRNYIEKLLFAMRTTWSSVTTKAVDYTVARCLFRCHRYKTNYIKEVTPCCQTRTPKTPISFLLLIC